jgi:hypothetical protein
MAAEVVAAIGGVEGCAIGGRPSGGENMMKIACSLALLALALAGCEQETVYRGSTLDRQFGQLNKEGWAVAGANKSDKGGTTNDPNVRVVREASFSGLQFHTNFQVDDPRYPELSKKDNQDAAPSNQPATPQAGANPWGALPITPGQ